MPEGVRYGIADIKALAGRRKISLVRPTDVAPHLIRSIESAALDQARRQTKRHRRVIGPLPRIQIEQPTANHVRNWLEGARFLKLKRGTQRIASREA